MPGELDIIDAAMAQDTYDYGDKAPVQQQSDANSELANDQLPDNQQQQTDDVDNNTILKQNEQPNAQQQQPNVQQQQNTQQQQRPNVDPNNPNNFKRVGAQFANGKGDIVDKDGKILARSGEAARLWQEASRATAQVNNLTRQLAVSQREVESNRQILAQAKEIAELPQRLGVSREDYNEGVTLMSKWRSNPVEVAREIVARTLTFGYNVSDILGKSAGDALEMKAITQLVNQTTAPIRQQQDQVARQQRIDTEAQSQHDAFIAKYPEAEIHGDAIARQMLRGVNPEVAFLNLKSFALEQGFDFGSPLGPQIVARQQGQRPTDQGQQQQQQQQQQYRAPMTGGNGRGSQQQMTTQPAMADAGDDWGSILRTVMSATN